MKCKKCGDIIIEPDCDENHDTLAYFTADTCEACYEPPQRKDLDEAIEQVLNQFKGER